MRPGSIDPSPLWRLGRLLALIAAISALTAAVPGRAAALPGPSSLSLGMVDYGMFSYAPPPEQAQWLALARRIGSTYTRLAATWSSIAWEQRPRGFNGANPRSRGYEWSLLDENVRAAAAHGQNIVLMAFGAPSWAERGGAAPPGVTRGAWFPDPAAFGAFGHALALRYSGRFPDPLHRGRKLPRVRYFQAWNEPNLPPYLMPQWERTPGGAWQPVSPGLYRGLLNAFYAGVKSAVRSDVVLAAGTAPYGDPPGTAGGRMFPVTFLQGLFCLTPSLRPQRCSDPPRLDALDHHPYSATPLSTTRNRGDIGVVQLYKIQRIVAAARRYRHVLPDGPKPLWVTEIDWLSTAPNTPEVQAQYLAQSFYELWRQGVTHVFWFEMRDPPPSIDPGGPAYLHTGLYEADGAPKPAIAAYRFPFVALSGDVPRTLILWGRAPARGTVLIQRLIRGRWRRFAVLRTTSGGIFYAVRKVGRRRQPRQFRAVIGRRVSPIWVNG